MFAPRDQVLDTTNSLSAGNLVHQGNGDYITTGQLVSQCNRSCTDVSRHRYMFNLSTIPRQAIGTFFITSQNFIQFGCYNDLKYHPLVKFSVIRKLVADLNQVSHQGLDTQSLKILFPPFMFQTTSKSSRVVAVNTKGRPYKENMQLQFMLHSSRCHQQILAKLNCIALL